MSMTQKNHIMIFLSLFTLIITIIVHMLHRIWNIGDIWHGHSIHHDYKIALNMLLIIPVLTFALTLFFYRTGQHHRWIPLLNTLTLTLSSIAMIAGGDGMVEYHFSIFMVLAMIVYYDSISLVVTSTTMFVVQHLAGYMFIPQLVYGVDHYAFTMVLIHAFFVLATCGALTYQIRGKKETEQKLISKDAKQKQIDDTIKQLSITSEQLQSFAEKISSASKQTNDLTHNVTQKLHQLSEQAKTQMKQTADSAKVIHNITTGVQHVAQNASVVSEESTEMTREAASGNETIQNTVSQMQAIKTTVDASVDSIRLLDDHSKEVEQIVELITDIASQTHLLALNAGIEAARAGEHGKGFTVVANEVKRLAQQSESSAKSIVQLIKTIQHDTTQSVENMDDVAQEVEAGIHIAQQAGQSFQHILNATQQISVQLQEMSAATQQMSAGTEQALAAIEETSSFAKSSVDESINIVHHAEKQIAIMKQNDQLVVSLRHSAAQLRGLIDVMKKK